MRNLDTIAAEYRVASSRLNERWAELCATWKDDRQRSFEREFVDPLERASKGYAEELEGLAEIIRRIHGVMGE